jgi:integrase
VRCSLSALNDDVVELLGAWWGECGRPVDDALVFPGSGREGYLNPSYLTRGILYPAMQRAGIPRVGPTGEKRTFHSLRHTYARIALQSGAEIFWLSRQMATRP